MISLKLAWRSVFRRPAQNLAVIMGIALGVSLFVGVQVGTDSLEAGFNQFAQHSLGEIDAQISSQILQFFFNEDIINEDLGLGSPADRIIDVLSPEGIHSPYIKGFAERLTLLSTVIQEDEGTIEIEKPLKGIDPDESGFAELYNANDELLSVASLDGGEIYIGEEAAALLFLNQEPIGNNLTISTTIFSAPSDPSNFSTSIPLNIEISVIVKDVFQDKGKGREGFSDYLVTDLGWLQNLVVNRFNQEKQINPTLVGFGNKPITQIIVNWSDDVSLGEESKEATKAVKEVFVERMGVFAGIQVGQLYDVVDIRRIITEITSNSVGGIGTILNVFGSIIILAGILVIINIQSMALASRAKETGIQRAVGAKRGQIIRSNLTESLLLGVIGSLIGLFGGALYGRLLVFSMGVAFEFPTEDIPTIITQQTLVWSFLAGFIISQITGLVPAIQASRVNVAQVLRGIEPPKDEKFGNWTLYLGILISVFGLLEFISLNPNPLTDGKDAFFFIEDAEAIYLPVILLILGPSLLFSYYRSKKTGLTFFSVFILIWANINIFIIFDWIREGQSGLNYILFIILSLIAGSILLFGMNLNYVAIFGQRLANIVFGRKGSSFPGTSMVAFRKMTSKKMRSTLTFALFATILTLNIFIATWSTSFRFGFDSIIEDLSGGTDVIFQSQSPIPDSIGFDQQMIDEFDNNAISLRFMRSFTMTDSTKGYLNIGDPEKDDADWDIRILSADPDVFWDGDEWIIRMELSDNKGDTEFETYKSSSDDPLQTEEDEFVWKALLNNQTTLNRLNQTTPIIVTTSIGAFEPGVGFTETHTPGDSVFLNLTDGSVQEFVIAATTISNPLIDITLHRDGPPVGASVWFVNDFWAEKLLAFTAGGLVGYSNIFLGKTNVGDFTSSKIDNFITQVEVWTNQKDGDFRTSYALFTVIGTSVYAIYEELLEGSFRFMQFLQAFVSFGFVVGILGLLVVASRSVAERKREIGMLRALGFRRSDVILSVVLELIVMALIGLFIGFINGTILGYALTNINSGGEAIFIIPWWLMAFYAALTVGSAIIAAIIPAFRASRIPPSDALRYTG